MRNVLLTKALTLLGFSSPFALVACYGTPTRGYDAEVAVEISELSAHKGDSTTLSIVAEGKWEIVSVPDFATVSQDSGDGAAWITVKAIDDNLTDECREGEIVYRDDSGEQSIPLSQLPATDEVALSTDEAYVEAE